MDKSGQILLVEDDHIDVLTVKRALKDVDVNNELVVVSDGEKALEYLKDDRSELPFIILLDLNMPRMNGIEFLEIIKNDNKLKKIPVIVLTTSNEQEDKEKAFDLGVAGYMIKPVDYVQFLNLMTAIKMYWSASELPED